jgi:Cu-Zn family superoxide dismutase
MTMLRAKTLAATSAATVGVLAVMGAAFAAGGSARSLGPDFAYGSANPFVTASAAVHVVKTGNGETRVSLHVRGVDAPAGQRFGAHVHQSPCGENGLDAGGHYQHAGATGSLEAIEVWLDFTVIEGGTGHSSATRPWLLDETSPRSVIIHAMPTAPDTGLAGARLACIDLDGEH